MLILLDGVTGRLDEQVLGLTSAYWDWNLDGVADPEDLRDFVTVSSAYYPDLAAHYRGEMGRWVAKVTGRRSEHGSGWCG